MIKVGIIDMDINNTHSLMSSLIRTGYSPEIIQTPDAMTGKDLIILPGVGAFPYAMSVLKKKGFDSALKLWASENKPLVGICLGMQLLYNTGLEMEETEGLGILKGVVTKLPPSVIVPHMGWNTLEVCRETPLLASTQDEITVYFVHSFYVSQDDETTRLATCHYGAMIPAIVKKGQTVGFQFHPEKSGQLGQELLSQLKEILIW
jgi:glutamine amidotransferase